MKTGSKSRTKPKAMTNATSKRRAENFNIEPLIQETKMNAPNTITLDNPDGDVEPQEVAKPVNLNNEPSMPATEADAQTITLDNPEGDVEPQEIAEPVISSNEPLMQATEADAQTISLVGSEGDVESQQTDEVAEFHEQRLQQEDEVADRNKSPIKPQGDEEYEQMLAENAVFTTKERIKEAAYFIAQRRGFSPGNELSDWCQAETEIESMLVNEKFCLVNN